MSPISWTAVVLLVVSVGGILVEGQSNTVTYDESGAEEPIYITEEAVKQVLGQGLKLSGPELDAMYHSLKSLLVNPPHNMFQCNGSSCQLCTKVLQVEEMCLSLEYEQRSRSFEVALGMKGLDFFRRKFSAASTPPVCVFGNMCGRILNMSLTKCQLCGTIVFNGKSVLSELCVPLQ